MYLCVWGGWRGNPELMMCSTMIGLREGREFFEFFEIFFLGMGWEVGGGEGRGRAIETKLFILGG